MKIAIIIASLCLLALLIFGAPFRKPKHLYTDSDNENNRFEEL